MSSCDELNKRLHEYEINQIKKQGGFITTSTKEEKARQNSLLNGIERQYLETFPDSINKIIDRYIADKLENEIVFKQKMKVYYAPIITSSTDDFGNKTDEEAYLDTSNYSVDLIAYTAEDTHQYYLMITKELNLIFDYKLKPKK